MKRYKEGSDRNQITFPTCLDEYISQDNSVRILEVIVESMNISSLGFKYETTAITGRKPYDPEDMFKLYVYSYFNGIRSSRKIERECGRNIEVMWLINNLRPDQKTISEFRRNNKKAIQAAFREFSRLCCKVGLVGKEIVAIDGSKFKASNSKDNYYTSKKLQEMIEYYTNAAQKYLDLLDSNDASEDDVVKLNDKLEYAKTRLSELKDIEKQVDDEGSVCTVDTDAKNMLVKNGGHDISYNVQISVDSVNHIVVAADVTNEGTDYKQLHNMAKQAQDIMQPETPLTVVADKGYYSANEFLKCMNENITPIVPKQLKGQAADAAYFKDNFIYDSENDIFICPQGNILTKMQHRPNSKSVDSEYRNVKACNECPNKELCTNSKFRKVRRGPLDSIADKVESLTKQNKELVLKRKSIVEHCFGIIKGIFGFSNFLTRGLESVRAESSMHFLIYNIKRMINILGKDKIWELLRA